MMFRFEEFPGLSGSGSSGSRRDLFVGGVGSDLSRSEVMTPHSNIGMKSGDGKVQKCSRFENSIVPVHADLMLSDDPMSHNSSHDSVSVAIDSKQDCGNHGKQLQVGCNSKCNCKQSQVANSNSNDKRSRSKDVGSQSASPARTHRNVVLETCVVGEWDTVNRPECRLVRT